MDDHSEPKIGRLEPLSGEPSKSMSVSGFVLQIWQGRYVIVIAALLGLAAGLFYASTLTPRYTAVLEISAAASLPGASSSGGSALGGVASLVGLGSSSAGASPFDVYLKTLTSRSVASHIAQDHAIMRRIFANQWNDARRSWERPVGSFQGPKDALKKSLGIYRPWHAPDAAQVQTYLQRSIRIGKASTTNPITTVTYDDADPVFAARFLNLVNDVADEEVRRRELGRVHQYIQFIHARLPSVSLAEQRGALAAILTEQERREMLAASGAPYAAYPIEPAPVAAQPSGASPILVILAFCVTGGLVGVFLALIDFRKFRAELRERMQERRKEQW